MTRIKNLTSLSILVLAIVLGSVGLFYGMVSLSYDGMELDEINKATLLLEESIKYLVLAFIFFIIATITHKLLDE